MNPASDFVDQARLLLDMVTTSRAASAASSAGTTAGASAGSGGGHADDCRWCPMCQAAAVVRGERPEVAAALADVLTAAAATLRSFADTDRSTGPEQARESTAGPADPPPVLHRVDIA